MAVQGKKINELTAIGTVSDETVLPAVYVSGTTVNSTANKISIEQISTKVQDDMSTQLAGKQDTLTAGPNITIDNNTISATIPEGVLTENNVQAGNGISIEQESDEGITISANIPNNVWTQDNLVAGTNTTITKKINPYVTTEDTLALFHLDKSDRNEIEGSGFSVSQYNGMTYDETLPHFGTGAWSRHSSGFVRYIHHPTFSYTKFTIDFWVKPTTGDWLLYTLPDGISIRPNGTTLFLQYMGGSTLRVGTTNTFDNKYHHVALVYTLNDLKFYIDGELQGSPISRNGTLIAPYNNDAWYPDQGTFDEIRISKDALWSESKFDVPTEPYAISETGDTYEINSLSSLPSQTGQSGKFLTTDGTSASWEEISISENTLVTEGLVPSSEFSVVSTNTPTAPMNGWYNIVATSSNTSSYITSELTATNSNYQVVAGYPSGSKMSLIIPAEKGRTFNFSSGNVYNVSIKFIPAEASERSMVPSNVSLSIPVQESGATYIAQETGYMNFSGNSANTSSYIISEATTDNPLEQSVTNHPSGYTINLNIPVVKGRTYKISYSQINNIQCKLIVGQEVKVYGGGGGADTSLSNLTDVGKTQVAHLAMPSVVYDAFTPPSSGGGDRTRYTAPADGYFVINYDAVSSAGTAIVNETKGEIGTYQINSTTAGLYTGWCPATKGDTIGVWRTVNSVTINWLRFYYAEGSKHEKQGA